MKHYMAELKLPTLFTGEFLSLIPAQRAIVDRLMTAGVILSYSLTLECSRLWIVLASSSEKETRDIVSGLPLSQFMQSNVHELTFHNAGILPLPQVSMN